MGRDGGDEVGDDAAFEVADVHEVFLGAGVGVDEGEDGGGVIAEGGEGGGSVDGVEEGDFAAVIELEVVSLGNF